MFRLSKEGEQKLLRTLYETLKSQVSVVSEAYANGDYDEIRKVGHSLRGNSGAAYFHLTQIGEMGKKFHHISDMQTSEFMAHLLELNEIVIHLQQQLEGSSQGTS